MLQRIEGIVGKDPPLGQETKVWRELIAGGRAIFAETALVVGGTFGQRELQAVDKFFQLATRLNPNVFNQDTREHLKLSGEYMELMGQRLLNAGWKVDVNRWKVLGLLHDMGRTFTHRKGRNEAIAETMMRIIGFSDDFMADFCPDEIFCPKLKNGSPKDINDLIARGVELFIEGKTARGFELVADLLAKKVNGRLRRWGDVLSQGHFSIKYTENPTMFPSEKRRWNGARTDGHTEATNILYMRLGQWAETQLGCSLDEIVLQMEKQLGELIV